MDVRLKPEEHIDDLQRNGLRIIQSEKGFRFGMDAVLLSDFLRLRPREHVVDMGTGTGILPLLLSQQRPDCTFDAIELQPDMAEMAQRSVEVNGLGERIRIYTADMLNAPKLLGFECADAVCCNPPYGKQGSVLTNRNPSVSLARHESAATISEITKSCAGILRNLGRLAILFPAGRLLELCDCLRQSKLEPKRIRLVYAKVEKSPYLAMVEAVKNARPALLWMPPLIVFDAQNRETPEIKRIYHMDAE